MGLCCPILRLCWPILRPMLAHVDPSWATRSEKWEKMRRAQNTVKRGSFWRHAVVGGRGRGPSLLRRGENCRTAMPRPGAPGRIKGCRPCRRPRTKKEVRRRRDDKAVGAVAGRAGPSFRALLFGRGGGAVSELGKLEDGYFSYRFRKQR